ncbi:gamma glutamyl transpeptidase [Holotrichia oblita]|uniref:Gamma glutamyl transpeptidase n=1 Tax=Holotrichia oblita TaxID=644536 RepID=A0ACB9SND8_HOLOL|nr:gamma glutamyl transpeptidase [Holotrichia oblita]
MNLQVVFQNRNGLNYSVVHTGTTNVDNRKEIKPVPVNTLYPKNVRLGEGNQSTFVNKRFDNVSTKTASASSGLENKKANTSNKKAQYVIVQPCEINLYFEIRKHFFFFFCFQTNDRSEYRIFTGTAERIIKWNKAYDNFCYYEVISSVISIKEGSIRLQKVMLLRDKKGPILQVVHYVNDHINIDDFHVGQMLRCVGRMVGPNTLHAVSIRAATSDELANLARLCYICDHAVAKTV